MELIKYEAARKALQECATIDEAKDILDKVEALRAYKRQQGDTEMEVWLAEMKLRARRRIGEISLQLEKAKFVHDKKGHRIPADGTPVKKEVLSQAGLSTSVANRCEKIAEISQAKFEKIINIAAQKKKPITYADAENAILNNKAHVSHNSGENEWYTPAQYVEAAREAMGGIDLDPASSETANQTVRAKDFYTKDNCGLQAEWFGRVWLNPPYGQPHIKDFAKKVCAVVDAQQIDQMIVLVNNATETEWFQSMAFRASAFCLLRGRIKFNDSSGEPKNAPLQGQIILYFGKFQQQFTDAFKNLGLILSQ